MKNINDWITENFLASERENKLNDLKEIILSDRASEVGVNGIVMPKIADLDDGENLIELFWQMLRNIESHTNPQENILDKIQALDLLVRQIFAEVRR
jgi:hypothetical protein